MGALPEDLRERLLADGLKGTVAFGFSMPPSTGARFIHRSHPLVGTLADGLLERTLADAGKTLDDLKYANYVKEMYMDSDTKIALLSNSPSVVPEDWFIPQEKVFAVREETNKKAGSKRMMAHFTITPGRPGWHIECSAMSRALLGDTIGRDPLPRPLAGIRRRSDGQRIRGVGAAGERREKREHGEEGQRSHVAVSGVSRPCANRGFACRRLAHLIVARRRGRQATSGKRCGRDPAVRTRGRPSRGRAVWRENSSSCGD